MSTKALQILILKLQANFGGWANAQIQTLVKGKIECSPHDHPGPLLQVHCLCLSPTQSAGSLKALAVSWSPLFTSPPVLQSLAPCPLHNGLQSSEEASASVCFAYAQGSGIPGWDLWALQRLSVFFSSLFLWPANCALLGDKKFP